MIEEQQAKLLPHLVRQRLDVELCRERRQRAGGLMLRHHCTVLNRSASLPYLARSRSITWRNSPGGLATTSEPLLTRLSVTAFSAIAARTAPPSLSITGAGSPAGAAMPIHDTAS